MTFSVRKIKTFLRCPPISPVIHRSTILMFLCESMMRTSCRNTILKNIIQKVLANNQNIKICFSNKNLFINKEFEKNRETCYLCELMLQTKYKIWWVFISIFVSFIYREKHWTKLYVFSWYELIFHKIYKQNSTWWGV